ncbi:hypothetical protein WJX74_002098 [Apatococcus lobatus]|uniref:Uncharacterized protein n=1 Tax=Apatococcus lobatus TaxID=904363 RepID=A0AAW1QD21_9CHLO
MGEYEAEDTLVNCKGVPRSLRSKQTVLQLTVIFEGRERSLTQQAFAKLLRASLKQLYGIIGGAVNFEIASYDEATASAYVQVNIQDSGKLKAAAAVISSHQGGACMMQVKPS